MKYVSLQISNNNRQDFELTTTNEETISLIIYFTNSWRCVLYITKC